MLREKAGVLGGEAGKRSSRIGERRKPCYGTLIFYYEDSTWVSRWKIIE